MKHKKRNGLNWWLSESLAGLCPRTQLSLVVILQAPLSLRDLPCRILCGDDLQPLTHRSATDVHVFIAHLSTLEIDNMMFFT